MSIQQSSYGDTYGQAVPKINVQELLYQAQKTPYAWLSLLETAGYKTRRTGGSYRCGKSAVMSIYKNPQGQYLLKNFNPKPGAEVPSGNILQATAFIHNLNTKTDFVEVCERVAALCGHQLEQTHTTTRTHSALPPLGSDSNALKGAFNPNQKHKIKQSFEYKFANWDSAVGNAVLSYWERWKISKKTLDRYGVQPLQAIQYKKSTYKTAFGAKDYAFAYCIDQNRRTIKGKRPNGKKGKKMLKEFYIQNTGNYCFGYNQLPPKGKFLIICGGEKDTLVINQHYNSCGVHAICYASERSRLNTQHLRSLTRRFEAIYCCFDNDAQKSVNTGRDAMHKNAREHGIPFIDIAKYSNENDIADIFEQGGKETLTEILEMELCIKTCIKKRDNDPFSIAIPEAYRIDVQRYFGEDAQHPRTGMKPLDLFKHLVAEHPRIALQARTGLGKSWGMMQLAVDNDIYEQPFEHIIITAPKTSIVEQMHADFKSRFSLQDRRATAVFGHTDQYDVDEALSSSIIFTTYDSLHKLTPCFSDDTRTLLIVDEFHELRNAHNYRKKAVTQVFEFMSLATNTIATSATPLYECCAGLGESLNYTLCVCESQRTQKITVSPIFYQSGKESDIFKHRLSLVSGSLSTAERATHIIKKDDLSVLKSWQQVAEGKEQSFDIFSSKLPIYKEENANYQKIMENGLLAKPTDWLGMTSLMDAGTSFKFPVESVTLINEKSTDAFVQFAARARYNPKTGENKNLDIYTYYKDKQKPNQQLLPKTNLEERLQKRFKFAQQKVDYLEDFASQVEQTLSKSHDDFGMVYYSELMGTWQVDYLGILAEEQLREQACSSPQEMFERIAHYHPHIEFLPTQTIDLLEDQSTSSTLKLKRESMKEQKTVARQAFVKENTLLLIKGVYHSTQNTKLKKAIRTFIPNYSLLDEETQQLISKYKEAFNLGIFQTLTEQFFELKKIGVPTKSIPKILQDHDKPTSYKRFKNRLITTLELKLFKKAPEKLSAKSLARVENYNRIMENVQRMKHHLRSSTARRDDRLVSKEEIISIVRKAIQDPYTKYEQARMRIIELYELTRHKKGSNKGAGEGANARNYKIGERVVMFKKVREYGFTLAQCIENWKVR